MAVDVNRTARIAIEEPASRPAGSMFTRLRSVSRRIWDLLVIAISGSGTAGIDESAFPSGFKGAHRRGSRGVRNLWHQPF